MKGGTYTKTFAKIQVRGIFRMRDIRRNVLPKLIEICLETPCWCSPGWAPTWRTETNRNICYRVCYKSVNLFLEKLINIKVILFLIHELLKSKISWTKPDFFNLHNSSLGRHVNTASRKSLEIQAYSIIKPRTLLKRKFVWKLVFSCCNASWK